ncbi:MAG: c-type cytochrome biogenesis protein CcmI [Paracoccaceae bacterium]
MLFWALVTAITICVAAFLIAALRIPAPSPEEQDQDLQFYKAQLDEVERDVARGILMPQEAQQLHAEIARRLLKSAKIQNVGAAEAGRKPWVLVAAVLTAFLLIGGSVALYGTLGAPGYADLSQSDRIARAKELHDNRPSLPEYIERLPPLDKPEAGTAYLALIEKLRQTVAERPNDLEGQILLAGTEASLQNFMAASVAQENVVRLKGADASVDDHFDHAELLIFAGRGYVSPEAETALERALALQNDHQPSLYYMGLLLVQIDRPDRAFRIWQKLLAEAEPDSPWLEPIRGQIEDVALAAGVTDFKLPPLPVKRGPTQDDIEAAGRMTSEEQQAMIEGMVEGLAERLSSEGGPPEDWAKLLRALSVLGRALDALEIYKEAQVVFADHPDALKTIEETARLLGMAE